MSTENKSTFDKLGDAMRQADICRHFIAHWSDRDPVKAAKFTAIQGELTAEIDALTEQVLREAGQEPCACGRDWTPKGKACSTCRHEAAERIMAAAGDEDVRDQLAALGFEPCSFCPDTAHVAPLGGGRCKACMKEAIEAFKAAKAAAERDLCPLCGEDRNHPSQAIRGGHHCHRP